MSDSRDGAPRSAVSHYSFLGLARWLWLRLLGKEIIVSGECDMCGGCCRALNLSEKGRWVRTEEEFRGLVEKYPEYARFKHCGFTTLGLMTFECSMLGPDNLCADHDNRPELCRVYPETDLYFMCGALPRSCGYEYKAAPSFRRALRRASRKKSIEKPEAGD
ncbi:MAG TPA: YkgJ family cysteine cluster protein [bacterium]|nr:YkgJ family cysteine cluster protein [bacterium]